MSQAKKIINKVVEWFSISLIVVMVLLVLWQVIARYVLNNPSTFSEALTRYMFVWLVLVTSTSAFGTREHMCISVFKNKLKDKSKAVVNILIEAITLIFAAGILVYGGTNISSLQMVQLDSSLHIPMGVIYSIIPICGIVIIFYCICNILTEVDNLKKLREAA